MMSRFGRVAALAAIVVAVPAAAQNTPRQGMTAGSVKTGAAKTDAGSTAVPPTMSTPSTTTAPVAPGSARMHTVATPKAPERATATGGNTDGGAN